MDFIVVDDDRITLFIAKKLIKEALGILDIQTFLKPEEALHYLKNDFDFNINEPAILLLDINMPVVSGWDFLNYFNGLNDEIKKAIHIYVVSSSVDPNDKVKALSNRNVVAFVSKPLTKDFLIDTFKK